MAEEYKDLTVILETRETVSRQVEARSEDDEDMEESCDEGIGENDSRNLNMQLSQQQLLSSLMTSKQSITCSQSQSLLGSAANIAPIESPDQSLAPQRLVNGYISSITEHTTKDSITQFMPTMASPSQFFESPPKNSAN